MDENTLNLPTPPTEESLQLLLRARLMLSHALEHSSQKTEFDNMIAILSLDSTIEYILRSIASHLDLESLTGKSFDIIDLSSLASTINRTLIEFGNVRLPYLGEIKLLRQTRNLVQHGAVAPYADLERFVKITERFFDKVLKIIFGFKIGELRISSVIDDQQVKKFLADAESYIDSKKWLEAVVASRNAFENEYFKRIKQMDISIALYPSIIYAKERHDIASYGFDIIKQELELTYLGINDSEYRRFKEYVNHIPHDFCAEGQWGQIVMQRPWEREDAIFCYNYVSSLILRWQAREKERLYTPKFDKEYVFNETIAGINITKGTEGGCNYIYDSDRLFLFYANKEIKRRFDKTTKNKKYKRKIIVYIDGKRESVREEEIIFLGRDSFLMTNEPERWGIVIWYRTLKDLRT